MTDGVPRAGLRNRERARWGKALAVVVPLLSTAGSLLALKALAGSSLASSARLASLLEAVGFWGPLLFLLVLTLRPLSLLPAQPFAAVAGMLWGSVAGSGIALAGSLLGAVLVALLGRKLLRRPLSRWAGERAAGLERVAHRHDLLYGAVVGLNPLLPTDVCLAVAAGAGARLNRLLLGMALGTVPTTVSTVWLGSALGKDRPLTMIWSTGAVLLSLAGGAVIARGVWRSLERPRIAPVPAAVPEAVVEPVVEPPA